MQKKREERQQKLLEKERRTFLKKAIYVAPTLVVLGHLSHPTSADAESFGPPGGPSGGPGGGGFGG